MRMEWCGTHEVEDEAFGGVVQSESNQHRGLAAVDGVHLICALHFVLGSFESLSRKRDVSR
jgi:hypothetical protein